MPYLAGHGPPYVLLAQPANLSCGILTAGQSVVGFVRVQLVQVLAQGL